MANFDEAHDDIRCICKQEVCDTVDASERQALHTGNASHDAVSPKKTKYVVSDVRM